MKIAIIGGGAMGSVYAALLGTSGNEVLLVDRAQDRVEAINRNGLLLEGPTGERRAFLRAAVSVPDEEMDLVVLAVKAADVGSAAAEALPLLGTESVVLTIQNGLGSDEVVASVVGENRLTVGIASGFGASIKGAGHAHHNAMKAVRMGPYSGLRMQLVEEIARVWRAAGFDALAVEDIAAMQWEKLICNVAYSAPCALTGMTVGEVMNDGHVGPISRAAAEEAWAVARKLGIGIQVEDAGAHVRAFGASMPEARPSALQDIEAGRTSEIDFINGAVPVYGRRAGIPTPVNETLVGLVKARERRPVGPAQ